MTDFRDKVELKEVEILTETDLAIQIRYEGKTYWIPKSQIDDDSEIWKAGEKGTLTVSEWIAIQKELV